jgi:hypothetical protein
VYLDAIGQTLRVTLPEERAKPVEPVCLRDELRQLGLLDEWLPQEMP